jgi:hypothetical protein
MIAARRFLLVCLSLSLAACGRSTIHVNGVMQQSSEMRPIGNVPLGGYQQMRVFVHPAAGQDAAKYGSPDCGVAMLEGTTEGDQLNNVACVPVETLNTAVTLVRQRLRAYGFNVVRERSEPFDYDVAVLVRGEAPRRADPMAAKAFAKITFSANLNAPGDTLLGAIDRKAAATAFDGVTRDCALKGSDLSTFSASTTTPMTPDFDLVTLTSEVVDDALGCSDLARFFAEARTRFPKPAAAPPAAPPASSPPSP